MRSRWISLALLVGLLHAAPAAAYPLRFPQLSEKARHQVEDHFRAHNPGLAITRLSVDAYGFIDLLGVAEDAVPKGAPVEGAGFSPETTRFWLDFLAKNAKVFGINRADALRMSPAPSQGHFNQLFGDHLLATIQISRPMQSGLSWDVRGHFWPGAAVVTPRIDGMTVWRKLIGGRVRHVEGGRMYPCDPVDPRHREEACPPGPPPRTVESVIDDKAVSLRQWTVLLRPVNKPAEIRTVWYAWVNLQNFAQAQMLSGKTKIVIDAVTGEDLTTWAGKAF
jgi:hypothetical protein